MVKRLNIVSNTGWPKTIFYIGLAHIVAAFMLIILAFLGFRGTSRHELLVIKGLTYYSAFTALVSLIYYWLVKTNKQFLYKLVNLVSKDLILSIMIGVLGSLIIIVSIIFTLFFMNEETGLEPIVNTNILIGFLLVFLSISSWLKQLDDLEGSKQVIAGSLFPVAFLIAYLVVSTYFSTTKDVVLLVFGSQLLVGGIIFSGLILICGYESILDKRESYLAGSVYTMSMLLLALYIIHILTIYTTTSILADNISSMKSLPETISLAVCDRLGLLIISYKLFLGLVMLMFIINALSQIVLMRKK